MKYYKLIMDRHLISVGTGMGETEITESEYTEILAIIQSRPIPPEGYGYRLKTDLTWELCELPPVPDEVEPEYTETDIPIEGEEK
jgi:hypothetical protein